ncbi:Swi3-domain-containing protein [Phanerochaete sordida]|uniref:Chromosome segregation in meiosis protein n=1 Tax=Phanerochaete sordida TaxID=48140 RepID=A0A9P3G3X3_9APHY|nr:Swi3-domain-containing protein [Phanerochaete sordida]
MDLDDIWDEPLTQSPPRSAPAGDAATPPPRSPAKRRRTNLFLASDSEGENDASANQPTYRARTPKKAVPDIDALFDDIDADVGGEDDDGLGELAPALDLDQLRRQAEARHARGPPLTPHEILPSSSPTRELEDDAEGGAGAGGKKKDGDGLEGNKKRKIAKLDDARLLGSNGFPALIKQAKGFKPRGKGHEVSDLNRLLQMYQFWTHKMFPKADFHDSVQRVEKLCHSKRMHSALGVWRDEYHGLLNGRKPEELNSDDESGSDKNDEDDEPQTQQRGPSSDAEVPGPEEARSSSPALRPPSSASEFTPAPDDDFDVDAILREEAEARKAAAASKSTPSGAAVTSASTQAASQARPPVGMDDDDDQAMWDELHAFEEDTFPPAKPSNPPASTRTADEDMDMDMDEDVWDVVREMEQEQAAAVQPKPSTAPALPAVPAPSEADTSSASVAEARAEQPGHPAATNDEGWDEMYE